MEEVSKYIYGIIAADGEMSLKQTGIEEGSQVYTINSKDMAAVVSDTSFIVCDPTRKNMMSHNQVLEALMNDYTILPARFGLLCDSEEKLRGLMDEYYSTLKDCLRKLENRMEVGVKVFWRKEKMLTIFMRRSPRLARLQREIQQAIPVKVHGLLAEAGELVKQQVEEWQEEYGDQMYMRLMKVAIDGKRNYPVDISNILNASFLVDISREKVFDAAIEELDAKHGDWAIFKCVKPVPPYNFVNLEMYLK